MQQVFEFGQERPAADVANRIAYPNHKICRRQFESAGTEAFANQAFDPIAVDRACNEALADDNAEARSTSAGWTEHLEMCAHFDRSGSERMREFGRRKQALRAPEPEPGCGSQVHTLKLWRPLARRARITALPPRDFMRTRNPCVLLRRTTDG